MIARSFTGSEERASSHSEATDTPTHGILTAGLSHTGLTRSSNQDRWAEFQTRWGAGFLVADGMGGHRGGERAAQMVADSIPRYLDEAGATVDLREALRQAITRTNSDVFEQGHGADSDIRGMGSTMVMVVTSGKQFIVAHCGDSRAYIYGVGGLRRLTEDDTVGNRMLRAGVLSADEALQHPDSGLLTRSLGVDRELQATISSNIYFSPGDTILLCSDGLSSHVPESGISTILAMRKSPEITASALIQAALEKGGKDNITVIVIGVNPSQTLVPRGFRRSIRPTQIGVAGLVLVLIFLGIRYLKSRHVSVPPTSGALITQQTTRVTSVPSIESTNSTINESRQGNAMVPPALTGLPIVIQLFTREAALRPAVKELCRGWMKSPDVRLFYPIRVAPGSQAFRLLHRKAEGDVTILYNPDICGNSCNKDNLSKISDEIQSVSGQKPAFFEFRPVRKEVGELASNLKETGVLMLLR